jgi:hypothetical protein
MDHYPHSEGGMDQSRSPSADAEQGGKRRLCPDGGQDQPLLAQEMERLDDATLAFARALGAPDDVEESALPFRDDPDQEASEATYVLHDDEIVREVLHGLQGDDPMAIFSPYGSGKTALRRLLVRDIGSLSDYIITDLSDGSEYTQRGLYVLMLTAILADENIDYELDLGAYDGGVRTAIGPDGNEYEVPHPTAACGKGLSNLTKRLKKEAGIRPVLVVDQIEQMAPTDFARVKEVADRGVELVFLGSDDGRERIDNAPGELSGGLADRITTVGRPIKPFEPEHITEYIARSLGVLRGEPYGAKHFQPGEENADPWDEPGMEAFAPGAVEEIHSVTDGHPRSVRKACNRVFTAAAEEWVDAGRPSLGPGDGEFQVTADLVADALAGVELSITAPDETQA